MVKLFIQNSSWCELLNGTDQSSLRIKQSILFISLDNLQNALNSYNLFNFCYIEVLCLNYDWQHIVYCTLQL